VRQVALHIYAVFSRFFVQRRSFLCSRAKRSRQSKRDRISPIPPQLNRAVLRGFSIALAQTKSANLLS